MRGRATPREQEEKERTKRIDEDDKQGVWHVCVRVCFFVFLGGRQGEEYYCNRGRKLATVTECERPHGGAHAVGASGRRTASLAVLGGV